MEVCFSDLKEKEIVNIYDGKKLGRIVDILFDATSGQVRGIVVPGDKKLFRKNDDIFVPLDRLKKIGDDVILVSLSVSSNTYYNPQYNGKEKQPSMANARYYSRENFYNAQTKLGKTPAKSDYSSYVRYKPLEGKKYR